MAIEHPGGQLTTEDKVDDLVVAARELRRIVLRLAEEVDKRDSAEAKGDRALVTVEVRVSDHGEPEVRTERRGAGPS